jgi:hypothetical protein
VKREGRHFKNICVLLRDLQESALCLVHLSQLITVHCLIIFYLSESCQYYSVFPLMYCLKMSLACHFCNLPVEQHNNISSTIKLCGEGPPSESGSQLSVPYRYGKYGSLSCSQDPVTDAVLIQSKPPC